MTAVLMVGATGAVGGEALKTLLASPSIQRVTTVGRRLAMIQSTGDKLQQHAVNLGNAASYESLLIGHDAAICTLGVGTTKGMSDAEFRRIDFDYVLDFAAACKRQGVRHFSLLGAVGANAHSRFFYVRCKGELEEAIQKLGFERVSFFRPSMILTPTNRYGISQAFILKAWPILDKLLAGSLKKYRGIRVEELGAAMARNAEQTGSGVEFLTWPDFKRILAA